MTVDEITKELIEHGWTWPVIDRVINLKGDWEWRMRLRTGVRRGPYIEGRGSTIMEAIFDAKNNSHNVRPEVEFLP
jgi:hypothetical protein